MAAFRRKPKAKVPAPEPEKRAKKADLETVLMAEHEVTAEAPAERRSRPTHDDEW